MSRTKEIPVIYTNIKHLEEMLIKVTKFYTQMKIVLIDLDGVDVNIINKTLADVLTKYNIFASVEKISIAAPIDRSANLISTIIKEDNVKKYFFTFNREIDKIIRKNLKEAQIVNKVEAVECKSTNNIVNKKENNIKTNQKETTESQKIDNLARRTKNYNNIIKALQMTKRGTRTSEIARELNVAQAMVSQWKSKYELVTINGTDELINKKEVVTSTKDTNIEKNILITPTENKVCDYDIFKQTSVDEATNVRYLKDPDLFQSIKQMTEDKGIFIPDEKVWLIEDVIYENDESEVLCLQDAFVEQLHEKGLVLPENINSELYNILTLYHEEFVEKVSGIHMDYC